MSSSPDQAAAAPHRPSLFISYASEDRAAARTLRDALQAAGLDVWYDENELGGGDAWDQKIRRQIRDCEYFMPLISAATERRKEGYFRREWRLAAERTMDMADDVLFLIPATLDGTNEQGARVPDKFLSVQWLRLPGGQPTAALQQVVQRILAGDHHALPRAATPPPLRHTAAAPAQDPAPAAPLIPPFPHVPEKGGFLHGLKFLGEIVRWALLTAWLLFKRAPKVVRVILVIWFVFFLLSTRCSRNSDRDSDAPPVPAKPGAADGAKARQVIKEVADKLSHASDASDKDPTASQLAKFGNDLARGLAAGLKDADVAGKQLVAVPFALGVTNEADAKTLAAIFTPLYGRLALERSGETAVASEPLPAASDQALAALGHRLSAEYALAAWIDRTGEAPVLDVRLIKVQDNSVAWTSKYPFTGDNAAVIGDQIATAVLAAVPKE
ncbi:MAG: toll/interleukin-1 receptor domain-containing protein [Verrucomicrobia bacterium]|nr:toll/interleukin-1 receptor domain-containing protein [Verrucomicrobiota bacterium]